MPTRKTAPIMTVPATITVEIPADLAQRAVAHCERLLSAWDVPSLPPRFAIEAAIESLLRIGLDESERALVAVKGGGE